MSGYQEISGDGLSRWDDFVVSHGSGSIYHHSSWLRLVAASYRLSVKCLVIEDNQGEIVAGLPFSIARSRYLGTRMSTVSCAQACNPLVSNREQFDRLMAGSMNMAKAESAGSYELKMTKDFPYRHECLGNPVECYCIYQLDLERPLEVIENSFHKSCIRRAIARSQSSGLHLRKGESERDVRMFYRLYLQMRKQHGLLPQPYGFFANMWKMLSPHGFIEILMAEYGGRVVAAVLLLKFRDRVTYEYGGTDARALHLHPAHFLLWTAIRQAHDEGFKTFDFGRTAENNEGLATFKSRWGAERRQLSYYYAPERKGLSRVRQNGLAGRVMRRVVACAPGKVCEWMGRAAYRVLA